MEVLNVLLLEDAHEDLKKGETFYQQESIELGNYFWKSILDDLESLKTYAGVHQKYFGCYRLICKKFPYAVYYETDNSTVIVIAILPMRADPKLIYGELSNRH